MPLTRRDIAATSIYKNAVPARAPFSGLSALSELAAELTEINELASQTLIDNKGFFRRLLSLFRHSSLPIKLEEFAARMRKVAQRSQGENLFFDNDAMPISMERVDITYETVSTMPHFHWPVADIDDSCSGPSSTCLIFSPTVHLIPRDE
jgi:hypothetical protein